MIDDSINHEYIIRYLRENFSEPSDILKKMRAFAEENEVPIAEPETAALLRFLCGVKRPARILEIGTAVGYSAICFSKLLNEEGKIDTIERDKERANKATENFKKFKLEDKINLFIGDAVEILPTLNYKYDFIFIDASKGKYPFFFEQALRLLDKDGIIFADNILYKGYVLSDYNKHKQRTAVTHLREYIKMATENEKVKTEILDVGDGLAVTRFSNNH